MKIKQDDIIIDEKNPFANCKFGRQKYGKILSNIIETYSDGFVLAINNQWGNGIKIISKSLFYCSSGGTIFFSNRTNNELQL